MKILVNRTDAIGDNLLSMPMASKLKECYPKAQIAFLVHPRCADLFTHHPYIDRIYTYDRKLNWFKRFFQLHHIFKDFSPTHFFHLGGCRLPYWVAWLRRVAFRGGLISKWSSFLCLNKGVRQKRSIVAMHESEYNIELLRPLGIEFHYTEIKNHAPIIHLTQVEREQAIADFRQELSAQGIQSTAKEMIFIHPGMTGHTLNWSSRNYGRLLTRLEAQFPGRFLFIISYTPSDEPYLKGIRHHLEFSGEAIDKHRLFFFDGSQKGLRYYANILSYADLFIGPSTGTTHMANVLGVKVIALFSPIKVQSALRWGPFHRDTDRSRILVPDVVCGESFQCAGNSCPYYECMAKIEVEDVLKQIPELLELE